MGDNDLTPLTSNGRLPWWIRATFVLGFPSAVALFLLAVVTGFIESPLTKDAAQRANEHSAILNEIRSARWNQIAILKIICVQSARDESGRRDCLSTGRDLLRE